jgi:hypothetical protein
MPGRFGCLSVAMLLICAVLATGPTKASENEKYCLEHGDNIVVYIDRTTPYDEIDKQALIDGVSRVFESLAGGERFVMRTITDASVRSATLVRSCVPICRSNGFLEDLFSPTCTEGVMLNDRKHLRSEIVAQMQALLENFVEQPYSDIVGTIAGTAPSEMRPSGANRFYLFTDLIENSPNIPGKDFFSIKNSKLIAKVTEQRLLPSLTGADIRIFGVGRSGKPDRPPLDPQLLKKLMEFWEGYFRAAGAHLTIQQSLGAIN